MLPNKIYEKLPNLKSVLETKLEDERPWDWLETRNNMLFPDKSKCSLAANFPPPTSFIGPCMPFLLGEESPVSTPFPLHFIIFSMSRFATPGGTLVHSCPKHKFVKGFCCWLYLACVAGVERLRRRQRGDGRRRA